MTEFFILSRKGIRMEARLREIQPLSAESWVRQNHEMPESPLVQPPVKSDPNQSAKGFKSGRKAQDGNMAQEDPAQARKLMAEVQDYLDNLNIQLSFDVHEKTGEMVVQVLDRESGELIRQLPPENLLDLKDKLNELRGVLFHQRA
jgi:flagellar protein FlaG